MTHSLLFLPWLSAFLLLLSQCLCFNDNNPLTTNDFSREHQRNLHGLASKLLLSQGSKYPNTIASQSAAGIFQSSRQTRRAILHFKQEKEAPSSASLFQNQLASKLDADEFAVPSRVVKRGLFSDVPGFFQGNDNQPSDGNLRMAATPQEAQPSNARNQPTSRSTTPASAPNHVSTSGSNSSRSLPPSTASATSLKPQATASLRSSAHLAPPAEASKASPSEATPASASEGTSLTAFQKFAALYQPTNRFEVLVIIITMVTVVVFLTSLVAAIKCVCHKKRFASKKDYPEGFPWVNAKCPASRSNSQRHGLMHANSVITTRPSTAASSFKASGGYNDPVTEPVTPNEDYQLNELGRDSYGDYSWALRELDIENCLNSPSAIPSASPTEESCQSQSSGFQQDDDQWDTRSLHGAPCLALGFPGPLGLPKVSGRDNNNWPSQHGLS